MDFFDTWFDTKEPHLAYLKSDKEHYRLLVYLSSLLQYCQIIDAGTHYGASALALGQNTTNAILSYDVDQHNIPYRNQVQNVRIQQQDIFSIDKHIIQGTKLILLDISPHNGDDEAKFVDMLIKYRYKGLVVFDDIFLNDNMKKFWNNLPYHKLDISEFGHATGTGIATFHHTITRFIKNET